MKKIRMTIDILLDEINLECHKATVEDIKNELIIYSDDVVDGFVVTRNNENNVDTFYMDYEIVDTKIIEG